MIVWGNPSRSAYSEIPACLPNSNSLFYPILMLTLNFSKSFGPWLHDCIELLPCDWLDNCINSWTGIYLIVCCFLFCLISLYPYDITSYMCFLACVARVFLILCVLDFVHCAFLRRKMLDWWQQPAENAKWLSKRNRTPRSRLWHSLFH